MSQRQRTSSRRISTAPVKKPFPLGFAAGVVVLVLALGGILVYAVQNTGSGFRTALDRLDETFSGLQVSDNLSAEHVATRVAYPDMATRAPDGGDHNAIPQTCAVYDAPIVPEHAVHSLEHGAVWVTYRPGLPQDQVDALRTLVEGNPSYRMLSPYPGQESPVSAQAWGRRLEAGSASDPQLQRFVDEYTDGPQTREKGASCAGVDQPGTEPFSAAPTGEAPAPAPDGAAPAPAPEGAPPAPAPAPTG